MSAPSSALGSYDHTDRSEHFKQMRSTVTYMRLPWTFCLEAIVKKLECLVYFFLYESRIAPFGDATKL